MKMFLTFLLKEGTMWKLKSSVVVYVEGGISMLLTSGASQKPTAVDKNERTK
jgi:hypothetical protein